VSGRGTRKGEWATPRSSSSVSNLLVQRAREGRVPTLPSIMERGGQKRRGAHPNTNPKIKKEGAVDQATRGSLRANITENS